MSGASDPIDAIDAIDAVDTGDRFAPPLAVFSIAWKASSMEWNR